MSSEVPQKAYIRRESRDFLYQFIYTAASRTTYLHPVFIQKSINNLQGYEQQRGGNSTAQRKETALTDADGVLIIGGVNRRCLVSFQARFLQTCRNWNSLQLASPGKNCTARCSQLSHFPASEIQRLCVSIHNSNPERALPSKTTS